MQRDGKFRGDLYARLNEYSLRLPPLRERKEDIYALCRALLARHGRPDMRLSFPFMAGLLHYDFPFNVRELEAIIKRGIALAEGNVLDAQHLPDEIKDLMKRYGQRKGAPAAGLGVTGATGAGPASSGAADSASHTARSSGAPSEMDLRAALSAHRGNVAAVGRVFGKERMQIHRWMKRYGINVDDYR
jgi:DNA-binding NtrC family response regulator